MDHLLFPRRIHAMHVDRAPLHDIESFAAIAFAKKVFALVEMFLYDKRRDRRNIAGRQTHEELTTAQRIFSNRLPELPGFQRHAAILTLPCESSRQKARFISSLSNKNAAAL